MLHSLKRPLYPPLESFVKRTGLKAAAFNAIIMGKEEM
jgi:hypothetical protein